MPVQAVNTDAPEKELYPPLSYPRTPIAAELQARLDYLVTLGRKWVTKSPTLPGQSCVVVDNMGEYGLCASAMSEKCQDWLDAFTGSYGAWPGSYVDYEFQPGAVRFNDTHEARQERIWWFQEAIAAAVEEGV